MSENIPVAQQSPRVINGTLMWYVGDAFNIEWQINLTDDGTPIVYQEGDKLIWNFFNVKDKDNPVHTFTFEYSDITNNKVTLAFTKEISKHFVVGSYTYCVKFISHDGRIVTINATNKVRVESCH